MEQFAGGSDGESPDPGNREDDGLQEGPQQQQQRRRRRPRLRCFLVVAAADGFFAHMCEGGMRIDEGSEVIVGAILTESFRFVGFEFPDDTTRDVCELFAWRKLRRLTECFGFVTYPVLEAAAFEEPMTCGVGASLEQILAAVRGRMALLRHEDGSTALHTLGALLSRWDSNPYRSKPIQIVRLCPWFAENVVTGALRIAHAVAVTRRINRNDLFVASEPDSRVLSPLLHTVGRWLATRARARGQERPRPDGEHDPAYVVACVDASRDLMDIKTIWQTGDKYLKLFGFHCGGDDVTAAMRAHMVRTSWETIRKARTRLDCTAMRLWRELFHGMEEEDICIHLFCDGSPQWRGLELWASSADVLFRGQHWRRLLPVVSLLREQLTATGKTACLLWQIGLLVGFNVAAMTKFCNRVCSITTNMGTERIIVSQPGMVVGFLMHALPHFQQTCNELPLLFGSALQVPGWKHLWDNVLQRNLSSTAWSLCVFSDRSP